MARNAVADPDLQIRGEGGGEGGHPDPEIRGRGSGFRALQSMISSALMSSPKKLTRLLLQKRLTSTLYSTRININYGNIN